MPDPTRTAPGSPAGARWWATHPGPHQEHPIDDVPPRPSHRRTALVSLLASAVLSSAAYTTATDVLPTVPSPAPDLEAAIPAAVPQPDPVAALLRLSTLPIKGHAPKTGCTRGLFGQSWTDDVDVDGGGNGCDTRNDILRRDPTGVVTREGTRGCTVTSGTLFAEYTVATMPFTLEPNTSPLAQIDHLVSLSNARQTGAQQIDERTRTALANDPLNLQAVDGAANQAKGDGDAATWLSPRNPHRCIHIARQVEVKAKYDLWVTPAEADAMTLVLSDCPPT